MPEQLKVDNKRCPQQEQTGEDEATINATTRVEFIEQ